MYSSAMVDLMSYISNMHINKYFSAQEKIPGVGLNYVITLSSPLLNSSGSVNSIFSSIIYLLQCNMISIALSMSFPIMLYTLVLEKEEKIKDLLEMNGLVRKWYWLAYIIHYFLQTNLIGFTFVLIGYFLLPMIEYYARTSLILQFFVVTVWNFSQVMLALFISCFIKSSKLSQIVGYLICILGI